MTCKDLSPLYRLSDLELNMTWGKCTVCTSIKDNMTEHQSKEIDDDKMIVCRDCHMTLEQYVTGIENVRRAKKDSQAKVSSPSKTVAASPS
jgi:protein-arginine kinase activator protein McsA